MGLENFSELVGCVEDALLSVESNDTEASRALKAGKGTKEME